MKTTLATHTGFRFEVRHACPNDEPIVAEFFTHVTPEDLRFRFLGAVKEVSHERLVAMTRSDDPHVHNFLAFSTDGMMIAVATLASDPADRRGEVAICIREDRKHLGVGWEFLGYSRVMPTTTASRRSSRSRAAKTARLSNSSVRWVSPSQRTPTTRHSSLFSGSSVPNCQARTVPRSRRCRSALSLRPPHVPRRLE